MGERSQAQTHSSDGAEEGDIHGVSVLREGRCSEEEHLLEPMGKH